MLKGVCFQKRNRHWKFTRNGCISNLEVEGDPIDLGRSCNSRTPSGCHIRGSELQVSAPSGMLHNYLTAIVYNVSGHFAPVVHKTREISCINLQIGTINQLPLDWTLR